MINRFLKDLYPLLRRILMNLAYCDRGTIQAPKVSRQLQRKAGRAIPCFREDYSKEGQSTSCAIRAVYSSAKNIFFPFCAFLRSSNRKKVICQYFAWYCRLAKSTNQPAVSSSATFAIKLAKWAWKISGQQLGSNLKYFLLNYTLDLFPPRDSSLSYYLLISGSLTPLRSYLTMGQGQRLCSHPQQSSLLMDWNWMWKDQEELGIDLSASCLVLVRQGESKMGLREERRQDAFLRGSTLLWLGESIIELPQLSRFM